MKQIKKITALFLSALMLTAALAGCNLPGAASPTPSAAAEEDIIYNLAGIPGQASLFTVNGTEVVAEEYLFWLAQAVSYMDQYAQSMGQTGINWEEEVEGVSMADYCKNDAMESMKLHALLEQRAQQEGCAFNDENTAELQTEIEGMITKLGGQESYELWLLRNGLSEDGFKHINHAGYHYQNLQDALYGENAKDAPSDESIEAYIVENDLLSAKHILLLTVDMNNYDAATGAYASLTADVIAEKKAQAEDLLAQLRASGDPVTLFDALMNEHSEDSGLSSKPDGYVFTAGEMVPAFETATRALAFGEISDIVESSFGYHIILRQDPDSETLRSDWVAAQMSTLMENLVTNAVVATTAEYDNLDVQGFYTKLLAHQAEVDVLLEALESSASPTDDAGAK